MRDAIAMILMLSIPVALWGLIKPYKGLKRRHFAGIALGLFIAFVIAVPPLSPEAVAAAKASEAQEGVSAIRAKAEAGLASSIPYSRADNPKTYQLIGGKAFDRLNRLEPGAVYAAAESRACDMVEMAAVSLTKSRNAEPVWFVDCRNGNRFLIDEKAAAEALTRHEANRLTLIDLEANCTTSSVALCDASAAQKAVKEVEVVSLCDMAVQQALMGDSSMERKWDYGLGEGDEVQVVRGFKAENAFGANLKHRYSCTFDAGMGGIKRLIIEGPLGTTRLI